MLLAALSGKIVSRGLVFFGFGLVGFVCLFWVFVCLVFLWHLRVITKKINTYSFSL